MKNGCDTYFNIRELNLPFNSTAKLDFTAATSSNEFIKYRPMKRNYQKKKKNVLHKLNLSHQQQISLLCIYIAHLKEKIYQATF